MNYKEKRKMILELAKALASNEAFMDQLTRSEPIYEAVGEALAEVACSATAKLEKSLIPLM